MHWSVALPRRGIFNSLLDQDINVLESMGIVFTSITNQESVLTINGTDNNNGTNIVCRTDRLNGTFMRCEREAVQVTFYGNKYQSMYTIIEIHTLI